MTSDGDLIENQHESGAPPCRLFVIPARDEPVAVILRRGPSKWVQVIRWETRRDTFTDGAWFKGRIYEEKCDLSPDGKLFVYFCHGGAIRPGYTDSWTAVSQPPWLYALALWPQGTTYGGGGRFTENRTLVLRSGMPVETHPDHPARRLQIVADDAPYHASSGEVEGADWSGQDHRGYLIYCRAGKLFRRGKSRRATDTQLADFNSRRPDPQPAPNWARTPIG